MRSSAQLDNRATCSTNPIGTGPFKISGSFDPNGFLVTRNASYWRRDHGTGEQLPYLDEISFRVEREPSVRSQHLRDGNLDLASVSSMESSALFSDLRSRRSQLMEYPMSSNRIQTLWINVGDQTSPLSNLNARKALAYATSAAKFLEEQLGGMGENPKGLFPKNSEFFTSVGSNLFDLSKARQHVAAYKLESGNNSLTFSMLVSANAAEILQAQYLKEMWAAAGIVGAKGAAGFFQSCHCCCGSCC